MPNLHVPVNLNYFKSTGSAHCYVIPMVENISLQYHLSFSLLSSHKKAKGDIQSIGRIVLT